MNAAACNYTSALRRSPRSFRPFRPAAAGFDGTHWSNSNIDLRNQFKK
jgi:hypothetical protein